MFCSNITRQCPLCHALAVNKYNKLLGDTSNPQKTIPFSVPICRHNLPIYWQCTKEQYDQHLAFNVEVHGNIEFVTKGLTTTIGLANVGYQSRCNVGVRQVRERQTSVGETDEVGYSTIGTTRESRPRGAANLMSKARHCRQSSCMTRAYSARTLSAARVVSK